MRGDTNYLDFISKVGRPILEIDSDCQEIALSVEDALIAIEILKDNNTVILGGDIFLEEKGKLVHAIHNLGYDYHYLNWYCNKIENEIFENYLKRSYDSAKRSIISAEEIIKGFGKRCFIVLVIKEG